MENKEKFLVNRGHGWEEETVEHAMVIIQNNYRSTSEALSALRDGQVLRYMGGMIKMKK